MTKDALGVKVRLQSGSCWRKAQCGPVKPACRITASFQSACYNLPAACPAPAPCSRATGPVCLEAHACSTHCGQPRFCPNRELRNKLSPLLILAMFPLFLPCIPTLDGIEKMTHLFPELEAQQQRSPWKQQDEPKKNEGSDLQVMVQGRDTKQSGHPACGHDEL